MRKTAFFIISLAASALAFPGAAEAATSSVKCSGGGTVTAWTGTQTGTCVAGTTDGKVIWRTDVFGWAWPRPAFNASKVFVSAVGVSPYEFRQLGSFSALDRSTGRILWRWPMPEWQGSHLNGFIASPLVAGRFVVVGGVDGSMYAFPAQ